MLSTTRYIWSNLNQASRFLNHATECIFCRNYAKKYRKDECRRAIVDIDPGPQDKVCTKPCDDRRKKKEGGILHKIKLKVIEGGTNFGTPFRRLKYKDDVCKKPPEEPKALPAPKKPEIKMPAPRPGVQVSILGADTAIGQYVALLLKQCSCIKKLRLYEAADSEGCTRNLCQVAEDLKHINTNCHVQAFSCACCELEQCLQNSDIVLILESGYVNMDMPYDQRFCYQAPIIKCYADVIANECPKAFIIVCATPIDCMVPLIAQTLKETGWYNPCKLLGSMAVPEMRASTLAARALGLEPRYTRVPCVGGTEGDSLVPLFSRAVEYFDFEENNALLLTEAVRAAPQAVSRLDEDSCVRAADLSEAHALAGLVTKVAHALLCNDVPRLTGFVETDPRQVISPASKYMARDIYLSGGGIVKQVDYPARLTPYELYQIDIALPHIIEKIHLAEDWHAGFLQDKCLSREVCAKRHFIAPRHYDHVTECITLAT